MKRWILSVAGLAFAGSLYLVGCEESNAPPPPPTKEKEAPKPDTKKTGAVTPAAPATGTALVNATSTVKAAAEKLACAKAGCTEPGLPTKSLVRDGKTVNFCCDKCLDGYKKDNNIQ